MPGAHYGADVPSTPLRVYAARLAGSDVFDPLGDPVGRVRDVVLLRRGALRPRAVGLVVEVPGRRRLFVPMTRVTSMDAGQVITTGLLNMRRFTQRPTEVLALGDLLERTVTVPADTLTSSRGGASATARGGDERTTSAATVEDVALEVQRNRDWEVTRLFVREVTPHTLGNRLRRRRGTSAVVDVRDVDDLFDARGEQGAVMLAASYADMRPPDVADALHEMSTRRRVEVGLELADDRLADVLQELPGEDQVEILNALGRDRAADVLEEMEPDDAADLLGELSEDQREQLLVLMEPDEAADVRRLLAYGENTAGGMMTTEPVILGPEATVAQALATVRREELHASLAAAVFVCRQPHETPTGRLVGMVHLQRLLREPPHEAIGGMVEKDVEPLPADAPLETVTRRLATYDLVTVPVVDEAGRLLGAVTVDDVLAHLLPDDWREADSRERDSSSEAPSAPPRRAAAQSGSSRGAPRG